MRYDKGIFIVFEGMDGSGKTTQFVMVGKYLENIFPGKVVLTKEPSNSKYGKKIRRLLYDKKRKTNREEFEMLFTLDRREHLKKEIIPALKEGKIVLSDRYYHSTLVYQLPEKKWKDYEKKFLKPDVTYIFDLNVNMALKRILSSREKITVFEKKKNLKSQRRKYLKLAKIFDNIKIINSENSPKKIFNEVINDIIKRYLEKQDKVK